MTTLLDVIGPDRDGRVVLTDSGLGGLSICAGLERRLRTAGGGRRFDLVYVNAWPDEGRGYNDLPGDAARAAVFDRALAAMARYRPDLVVIACNTLSVVYEKTDFARSPVAPVTGIVDAGVELFAEALSGDPAATLVLFGTRTTVASGEHVRRLAARGIDPVTMAAWRAMIAGVGFAVIWLIHAMRGRTADGPDLHGTGLESGAAPITSPLRQPVVWLRLVALGLIGVSVFYTALPAAIERGGITLAWVLLYTAPLWVLIGSVSLGWLRPTVRAVTLVLLATGGVALTAAAGGEGVTVSAAAVAWGLAAGLSYASYYLVGRTLVETLGPIR
ncbi:MAG: EamA family transporter, partial [Acidobacteria bacterium]|nr:EamA family transporter [Acidobacteriota bacterium]